METKQGLTAYSDFLLGQVPHRSSLASLCAYKNVWPSLHPSVFLACGSRIIGNVEIGELSSVWFNAVVRGDVHWIRIGKKTNIQDGACIHCTYQKSPTLIGDFVSVAHNVVIHGCTIEDGCLIGMGAIVMDNVVIGKESLVGAGALVTSGTQIPPRSLVLGSPAKVVRSVSDDEYRRVLETTNRYIEYAKGFDFSGGL